MPLSPPSPARDAGSQGGEMGRRPSARVNPGAECPRERGRPSGLQVDGGRRVARWHSRALFPPSSPPPPPLSSRFQEAPEDSGPQSACQHLFRLFRVELLTGLPALLYGWLQAGWRVRIASGVLVGETVCQIPGGAERATSIDVPSMFFGSPLPLPASLPLLTRIRSFCS